MGNISEKNSWGGGGGVDEYIGCMQNKNKEN